MDAENISRSSNTYIEKLRSNFLGTKFIVYDTHPPINISQSSPQPLVSHTSRRFYSKKVSLQPPNDNYNIGQVTNDLNILGTPGPCKIHVIMHSIPVSTLEPRSTVPLQPQLLPSSLDDSFHSITSTEFGSSRFTDIIIRPHGKPLVLRNKVPRWHEQLQCWCLNFKEWVTIASVKNFQVIAATQPSLELGAPTTLSAATQPAVINNPRSVSTCQEVLRLHPEKVPSQQTKLRTV